MTDVLLEISGLRISFPTADGHHPVLDGVDLQVRRGRTVALVGESGSGKTLCALAALGLLADLARVEAGRIDFDGEDLLQASETRLSGLRGSQISIVFEEPGTSLDPYATVGAQVTRPLRIHGRGRRGAKQAALEIMSQVGIANPEQLLREYPHELSEGNRQRVLLATALICRPKLVILDEPTTAIDTTSQAQVIDCLKGLQQDTGLSVLVITHDLGLVAETADDVVVMYAGQVVEHGHRDDILNRPTHPYTRGMLGSIPPLDVAGPPSNRRLPTILGSLERDTVAGGCPFRLRCAYRHSRPAGFERCDEQLPPNTEVRPHHTARCHFAKELA